MAKVLVVGTGGREHALGWGLNESPSVEKVYLASGNAGTALLSKAENVALSNEEIVSFARDKQLDLVVIGPEAPAVAGLGNQLRTAGINVFGPNAEAAQLEGSKAFATKFMLESNIPLPPSEIITNVPEGLAAINRFGGAEKSVIKASGLAAGKGVFLPDTEAEARTALAQICAGEVDGDGSQVVIQQRYHGPEVSIFVLSDATSFTVIPIASQDHKRLLEGDKGPNTGGMGVYAPLPDWMISQDQWTKIETIARQTFDGMKERGMPYEGVLYIGLMLAEELNGDPIVIEYNARFGDPETEVLIPLLVQNGVDIYEMLYKTAAGKLSTCKLPTIITGSALTICVAAKGYPANPQKGDEILGLDKTYGNVKIFHGGTAEQDDKIVTAGGRVLYIVGFGENLEAAQQAALAAIGESGVHFESMQYRPDIGHRAIK